MNNIPKDADKIFIVDYAPIFANLKPAEKNLILQKSKIVEFRKGDIIYKRLDAPDAFYCVVSGRVRIYNIIGGEKETLEYLNCGKYFGMISLLTGEPHSVTAEAANDSKILKIDKQDFQTILEKVPQLAIDLSKTLSRRLRKKDTLEKRIFESHIISVYSAAGGTGCTMYAFNLALSLRKETARGVILVDISKSTNGAPRVKLDGQFLLEASIREFMLKEPLSGMGILNIWHDQIDSTYSANLNVLLTYLTGEYHYVVVDLPALMDEAVFQTLSQSDMIHIITDCHEDNLIKTKNLISQLFAQVKYPQEKIKVILNIKKEEPRFSDERIAKTLSSKIYATLPWLKPEEQVERVVLEQPHTEYARAVRRIAREIGGVRVGLVLSGGAALGLAHIGVIKVLERENIPIDIVVGSSMGALIASLWAAGLSSDDLEQIALEFNQNKKKVFRLLVDPIFPKMSFFKGRQIRRLLTRYIGNQTFKDLKFPLKVVALNLSRREEVVFDSGSLVDAVMASIAIPGIFSPVKIKHDLLIDGGTIAPLPLGPLVKMGIKKIIAVNVLPSPQEIILASERKQRRFEEAKRQAQARGFFAKMGFWLRTHFEQMLFPNILDIIINSIEAMEYVIAQGSCQKADVVIQPTIYGVDWFEFFKAAQLIKKGEEETERALSAIKSVIKE